MLATSPAVPPPNPPHCRLAKQTQHTPAAIPKYHHQCFVNRAPSLGYTFVGTRAIFLTASLLTASVVIAVVAV
ncbi:hypothetical protein B0H13DRAFT_2336245 [Mycena leptocephala]|nr:hypothetical protein B0H13DRAFT_2336245 [Mycena leptocephala]